MSRTYEVLKRELAKLGFEVTAAEFSLEGGWVVSVKGRCVACAITFTASAFAGIIRQAEEWRMVV